MPSHERRKRGARLTLTWTRVGSAAVAAALLSLAAQAAPLNTEGRPLVESRPLGDTAAEREFRAGVAAQLKGDRAGASARFEAALRLDPKSVHALIGLASLAQAQGNKAQIEAHLMRAEQIAPRSPEVQLAWGQHFLAGGQLDLAEKSFNAARSLAPKAVAPLLQLAEVQLRRPGRHADAQRAYRDALALEPRNPFAQFGLGVSLAAGGLPREAQRAFEQTAELAPKDPAPLRAIGRLHLEAGDTDKALEVFDRGLALQPQFLPLMLDRSDALARQAQWPAALAQLQAAEKLAPQSAEIALKLADIHQAAGRWAQAETSYLKSIAQAPNNPMAYNNLAWMTVARKGDTARALAWARKAVELAPGSSPLLHTLGWVERAAGDLPAAAKSLQRAITLEPRVAGYHYHLGLVLAELKHNAAARNSLQRALDLDASLPEADEARRLIKALAG